MRSGGVSLCGGVPSRDAGCQRAEASQACSSTPRLYAPSRPMGRETGPPKFAAGVPAPYCAEDGSTSWFRAVMLKDPQPGKPCCANSRVYIDLRKIGICRFFSPAHKRMPGSRQPVWKSPPRFIGLAGSRPGIRCYMSKAQAPQASPRVTLSNGARSP